MLLIRKKPNGYKNRLDIKQQNPAEWHWKLNDESVRVISILKFRFNRSFIQAVLLYVLFINF